MEEHKEHLISSTDGTVYTPWNVKGKELEEIGVPIMCSRDKIQYFIETKIYSLEAHSKFKQF